MIWWLTQFVDWTSLLQCAHLEPTRIGSHDNFVRAVAVWRGHICSASDDGLIHIWGRDSVGMIAGGDADSVHQQLLPERTLDSQSGSVWALISWNGWLISAGVDSLVRVSRVCLHSIRRALTVITLEVNLEV